MGACQRVRIKNALDIWTLGPLNPWSLDLLDPCPWAGVGGVYPPEMPLLRRGVHPPRPEFPYCCCVRGGDTHRIVAATGAPPLLELKLLRRGGGYTPRTSCTIVVAVGGIPTPLRSELRIAQKRKVKRNSSEYPHAAFGLPSAKQHKQRDGGSKMSNSQKGKPISN